MSKKPKFNFRGWLVAALVAFIFFSAYKAEKTSNKVKNLTTLEFYRAIKENRVVQPVQRTFDIDNGTTSIYCKLKTKETDGTGALIKDEKGNVPTELYHVVLVPGENERLMNELLNAGINTEIKESSSSLSPVVIQIIFFVAFLLIFYFLFYKKTSSGMFSVGKSRARLLNGKEEKHQTTFDDVAGIDEAKEEVQEIVEFLKEPEAFQRLGGRIPKGVLLVGPPGTGKTLLAKAIAGEAKVPFYAISGSDFEEMFVGVGASRMRDMFAEAKKNSPCIIFIDEIDSIGMKRTGTGAMGNGHSHEQTLNTMLVEMDGFDANEGVIVIAATNRPDTLDSALLRPGRFDRQVMIDLPTLKGRLDILKLHGKKILFDKDADLEQIARGTPGFSGADLANLLNEAALLSVKKKLDAVNLATLEESRDKVLWGRERKSSGYSQDDRQITAWHEAGHALVQLLTPGTDPLHKVTIIPRGRALGATMSLPEKDVLNHSRSYFLAQLRVCCAGRIAEEMFTGDISTGAAQDIMMATQIARDMVCKYAMSDKFGFQSFYEKNRFATEIHMPQFSEETSRMIDEEVKSLIDEAYADAKRLVEENKTALEILAAKLLEKETMSLEEVQEIVK
jgi:cell division protease FtsH